MTGGKLELARGPADDPATVIATNTVTLPEVLWRDLTLEEAERAGTLSIEGSRRAAPLPRRVLDAGTVQA